MALQSASPAYFTVRQLGVEGVQALVMSATEGGPALWVFALEGATHDECRDSLAAFLDNELERNVEPTIDDKVIRAPDVLRLGYDPAGAVLDGVESANAPLVTWEQVEARLDRMFRELEYLVYLFREGQVQDVDQVRIDTR